MVQRTYKVQYWYSVVLLDSTINSPTLANKEARYLQNVGLLVIIVESNKTPL